MKILHVTPAFHPAYVYGGPIGSVYQLCRHQAQQGCKVQVLTSNANGRGVLDIQPDRDIQLEERLDVRYCRRRFGQMIAPSLISSLWRYVRDADIVHLTGVYSFPTIPTLAACRLLDKPIVWSPRGALQRWDRSRRTSAKVVWEYFCKAVAPRRLMLHVTAESEALSAKQRFPGAEMVIVPNGVMIPEEGGSRTSYHDGLSLLYLGRLDQKKGIENLLTACSRLNNLIGAWSLTVAGGGEASYTASLLALIGDLGLEQHARLVGEVKRESIADLFSQADVVVVPSFVENFCMVVAEALAHGVPVIASTGTPWSRVSTMGCGLWVDNNPESLVEAIVRISRMPLREMGRQGREWMVKEFGWPRIASDMQACYLRMLRGGGDVVV